MTKDEFKAEMRLNRGRLSSRHIDDAMGEIYDDATVAFAGYMLTTKKIGIDKALNIVGVLRMSEQDTLVSWIEKQPANLPVSAIEMKVSNIITSR